MPSPRSRFKRREASKSIENAISNINPNDSLNVYRTLEISYLLKKLTGKEASNILITDVFSMLFLPAPQLKERYNNINSDYFKVMSDIYSQIISNPIRHATVSDIDASTVMSVNIISNLVKNLEDIKKGSQLHGQQGNESQQEFGIGGRQNAQQFSGKDRLDASTLLQKILKNGDFRELLEKLNATAYDSKSNTIENAARDAVNKAGKSSESLEDMQDKFSSAGKDPGTVNFTAKDQLAEQLSKKSDIRALLKVLNGLKRSSSESHNKSRSSLGGYSGYDIGDDIRHLAAYAYTFTDDLFFALLAKKELPIYKMEKKESNKTRYVLFDKSDSMQGRSMTFAKALAISIYLSAQKDKSDFFLRFFDACIYDRYEVLKNARRDAKEVMQHRLANIEPSGGTDIQLAILAACREIKEDSKGKNNQIILITDGESEIDVPKVLSHLKDANAELVTIYINSNVVDKNVKKLVEISDNMFIVTMSGKDISLKLINVKDKNKGN